MRLKPKKVGDDFTVDDYNAIVYLLKQEEWIDANVPFSTEKHKGNFATYSFTDPYTLLSYSINGDYVVSTNKQSHDTLYVYMQDELIKNTKVINNKLIPTATYDFIFQYILPKETQTRIGIITIIGNEVPDIVPPNSTKTQAINHLPDTINEKLTLTHTETTNTNPRKLTLPKYIIPGTIIKKEFNIKLNLNPDPEIDFNNGKISEPDEIIVHMDIKTENGKNTYTYDSLQKMIEAVPRNGKEHIFRLVHDDKTAYLQKEIVIHKGQNIIIRGGTRHKTLLDGTVSSRLFRVEAGGKLTLENLRLENCTNLGGAHQNIEHEIGYGGAIFVGYSKKFKEEGTWGVLNVRYCDFKNCIATNGGAIASYHARLYVSNCTFTHCHTQNDGKGGAIYYNNKKEVING